MGKYSFGKTSQKRLDTCHEDLQKIMNELIKIYDVSVIEGTRSLETQQKYFAEGKSHLDGVTKLSKHQSYPSMAIDVIPYKKGHNAFSGEIDDIKRFCYMAGLIWMIASRLYKDGEISYRIRWGGDWNMNDIYTDQNFHDLPHFELI